MAKLHAITDARAEKRDLAEFARAAFAGGVDMLQVRDPGLAPAELAKALDVVRKEAVFSQALVVTDDPVAASAFGGDVVHLAAAAGSAAVAKAKLHRWALLGRSAHTPHQLHAAIGDTAVDYLFVGPIKMGTQDAADLVATAVAELPPFAVPARSKPWFAMGGINSGNVADAISRGVRRVCVSRALTGADDPEAEARALKSALVKAWADDPASEAYMLGAFAD